MANIKKRPNGTYQATIYVGRDENGKLIREYITREGLKECKLAAKERELEIASGNAGKTSTLKMLVNDYIDQWLEQNKKRLSPGTYSIYKDCAEAHYKPYFQGMTMRDISGDEALLRSFKAKLHNEKKLSIKTTNNIMSTLSKMFREGLRDKNPCRYIELDKPPKYQPLVISSVQFEAMHGAFEGTPDELFLLFGGWCGMRLGEICALTTDDILYSSNEIIVNKSLSRSIDGWVVKPPKSDNGFRKIAAPPYLFYRISQIKPSENNLLGYFPSSYSHRWKKLLKEHNFPPFRFHDLRHYHATWLFENGVPDLYAAGRLGDNIQTVKKIYQHLRDEKAEKLNQQICEGLVKKIGCSAEVRQTQ